MLRLVGVLLLMAGSIGLGWSIKEKWKASLEVLYQMRQIFEMLPFTQSRAHQFS